MDKTLHQVWLRGLAKLFKRDLCPDYDLETVVSYGFPRGNKSGDHYRGITYTPRDGGHSVILIHPSEWSEPRNVVRTFVHEALHAAIGTDATSEHGPEFAAKATDVGLGGQYWDTPNEALDKWITKALALLPEMPSDPLGKTEAPKPGRLHLWQCTCGVKIRSGRKDLLVRCELCNALFERK